MERRCSELKRTSVSLPFQFKGQSSVIGKPSLSSGAHVALLREALGAPGAGSWMGAMLRLPCVVAVSCV